jgi:Zn-dependent peptidase ImmA (M78 family)
MVMGYKQLYKELATSIDELRCAVYDYDFIGFCNHTKKFRAFIYIDSKMSYKEKYFTLAHEAGHLFYMSGDNMFNWSKKIRSETKAHAYAVKLLDSADINEDEYYIFYSKAKSRRGRKKSWSEL